MLRRLGVGCAWGVGAVCVPVIGKAFSFWLLSSAGNDNPT
jgi:hypothetical protein